MLYADQLAEERSFLPGPSPLPLPAPGALALDYLCFLSGLFSTRPEVLPPTGGRVLLLFYRDAAYRCDDICGEECRDLLAAVSQRWPLTVFGTSSRQETGRMTVRLENGAVVARKYCVSGSLFSELSDLCIRLETKSAEQAQGMAELAGSISPDRACAVVGQGQRGFLQEQGLRFLDDEAFFLYLPLPKCSRSDRLCALSLRQKEQLWQAFLEDGAQPREFEWLWEESLLEGAVRRLEWEIALQSVLERIHFRIENRAGGFLVADSRGSRRTFDYERGTPAERVFLKMLFPLGRTGKGLHQNA